MTLATACRFFRNAVRHDTCAAGVRFSDVTGADRDGLPRPGLPCWYGPGSAMPFGGVRVECVMYEPRDTPQ